MNKIKIIFLVAIFTSSVFAGSNGGYAGAYLRMGLGARSISMGNTGIAAPVNAFSAFYNPAAVGTIKDRLVGLSYSFLSLDRRYEYIGFSMQVPPAAGFSLGWIESGVGDIVSANSIGVPGDKINHSANAVYFAFGRQFNSRLSVGIAIKILFEFINDGTDEFDYSSNGVGFDFGVMYQLLDDLTIAYQLRDINSKLKANTDKIFERGGTTIDRFPVIHKIGGFYNTPLAWLNATYEFEWNNKQAYKHHIGFEAIYGKNLAVRTGLNDGSATFGAGMDFRLLNLDTFLDYAFIPSIIDEGSSHIFSWQILF